MTRNMLIPENMDSAWLDREAYPFKSRSLNLSAGRIHYLDEGPRDAPPVLMLHGNPTWSFLYRHLVLGLSDDYRCIAPDYLGFGLSERPSDFSYRPEAHAEVISELVEDLGLKDITFVVQDWGGPIGLSCAIDNPDNARAIVAMNTFCWPLDDRLTIRLFARFFGSILGRVACERYDAFTRLMGLGFADRSQFEEPVHQQYQKPHEGRDRTGTWVFPYELINSSDWLASLEDCTGSIEDIPTMLPWGLSDLAFGKPALRRFESLFRDSETLPFEMAGHYVQEEVGDALVPPVRKFLNKVE